MGKIVAIGGGFGGRYADFLVRHILELSGKKTPNFLMIPTAAFDGYGSEMLSKFFNCGCEVDVLCLSHDYITEELIAKKVRKAEVIYVPGGNLRYLSKLWKESNLNYYLKEAYEAGKVLFGVSSGSMCWFQEGYDDCGPENAFMFVDDTLGLLPYANCPHYDSFSWQSFTEAIKTRGISAIACENDAAICFVEDQRYILHSPERKDARCWFFDKNKDFARIDLDAHPEVLAAL